jgi:hypothetical protein
MCAIFDKASVLNVLLAENKAHARLLPLQRLSAGGERAYRTDEIVSGITRKGIRLTVIAGGVGCAGREVGVIHSALLMIQNIEL